MKEQIKTGTTTVGIVCKDGIVLAADKRATAGNLIVNKRVVKIIQIADKIGITTAGTVSDVQLLAKLVKAELRLKDLQTNRFSNVKESANLLAGLVYANIRKLSLIPGITSFLLGGVDEQGPQMYDVGVDGSALEIEDYHSDGSGSVFALGVLETLYQKGMSTEEGVKLAVKCISAAMQRDSASGNGVDVAVITNEGMRFVVEKRLEVKLEL